MIHTSWSSLYDIAVSYVVCIFCKKGWLVLKDWFNLINRQPSHAHWNILDQRSALEQLIDSGGIRSFHSLSKRIADLMVFLLFMALLHIIYNIATFKESGKWVECLVPIEGNIFYLLFKLSAYQSSIRLAKFKMAFDCVSQLLNSLKSQPQSLILFSLVQI